MIEISRINESLSSWDDLINRIYAEDADCPTSSFDPSQVRVLNLHSNAITRIEGRILATFRFLTLLDLSSNLIEQIEGLGSVPHLIELNLSNNKIEQIQNLHALYELRYLNLSFNNLRTLDGIAEIYGDEYALQALDIQGNAIDHFDRLRPLIGCTNLQRLILHSKNSVSRANPICGAPDYSPSAVFLLLRNIRVVDGLDRNGCPVPNTWAYNHLSEYEQLVRRHGDNSLGGVRSPTGIANLGRKSIHEAKNGVQAISDKLASLEKQMSMLVGSSRPLPNTAKASGIDTTQLSALYNEIKKLVHSGGHDSTSVNKSYQERVSHLETQMLQLMKAVGAMNGDEGPRSKRHQIWPASEKEYQRQYVQWKRGKGSKSLSYTEASPSVENDENSDSSEYITVPTKVPRGHDNKRQSLVWVEDGLNHGKALKKAEDQKSAGRKPLESQESHLADENQKRNSKPSIDTNVALAANAKLISAMEKEQERLRANEIEYAEQIKQLSEELAAERTQRTRAEDENGTLQTEVAEIRAKHEQLQESTGELSKETENLRSQLQEMKANTENLTQELAATKTSFSQLQLKHDELSNKNVSHQNETKTQAKAIKSVMESKKELRAALADAEYQVRVSEEDKTRLSVRLVKEREQSKIKIAEMKKETEIYKDTIQQLQKDVHSLQEQLASKVSDIQYKYQQLSADRHSELRSVISETTAQLTDKYKQEIDEITKQLRNTRQAYDALEEEFRKGMKDEQTRYGQLQSAYAELSERYADHVQLLEKASGKENEMAAIIQELTTAVKEQKRKIAEMSEKHQMTYTVFEEKVRTLEDRLKAAHKWRAELKTMQADSTNNRTVVEQLTQQITACQKEKARLQEKLSQLQADNEKLSEGRDKQDQAIRVKNKMLDDQNETIRTLKQNLDNKSREHQLLLNGIESREEALQERLDTERQANKDIQEELESQAQLIDHLQSRLDDYKDERNSLKKELTETTKKLKERNDSIHMIEEEVARIRKVFKSKEEKWMQEKEEALRAQEQGYIEMKITYEAQSSRLAALERERELMLQRIHKLQQESEAASKERAQHEAEMRLVLTEMDRQKQKMSEKMERLKAAFVDI